MVLFSAEIRIVGAEGPMDVVGGVLFNRARGSGRICVGHEFLLSEYL
jgi:hypothetical protein